MIPSAGALKNLLRDTLGSLSRRGMLKNLAVGLQGSLLFNGL
jgi:hypothetical protein